VATYVLIHGASMLAATWNQFSVGEPVLTDDGRMGGRIWDPIVPALEGRGHRVLAPTLESDRAHDLSQHLEQVTALAAASGPEPIVLVGHGYGGMVATGVADRLADRVRRIVYVDAALPEPGQSLFDVIRAGDRDPLSFEGVDMARPYVEALRFDAARVARIPRTYVRCTDSEFAPVTRIARQRIEAHPQGWTYVELPGGHLPMARAPAELARILLEAGEAPGAPPS